MILRKVTAILAAIIFLTAFIVYFWSPNKGKGLDSFTHYELIQNWPKLPSGLKLGNPVGLGIDTNENILVLHRADRQWPIIGPMPQDLIQQKTVLIFSKATGHLIESWGENKFVMPHGLHVDQKNNVWITDVGLHQIFKFTHDGRLLFKIGEAGVEGNDNSHFNKPTDIAVADDGSFYVGDGYENSRIIKFSPSGEFLLQWGAKGSKPGQFKIPHALSLDQNNNVYVADRENNRVQEFNSSGKFIQQWSEESIGAMCSVFIRKRTSEIFAIDDYRAFGVFHKGSDIFKLDKLRRIQSRFGRSGGYQGPTCWYHDLVVDAEGNVYVGDILNNVVHKFKVVPGPI